MQGPFSSAAEYDALVRSLVASGVISDPGMIYFDVRPSSHVPTIEVRICDACPSVDTVVLIAAGLFRAIVARELARYDAGEPSLSVAPVLHRAAMWRAARSGLEGELVDLAGPRSVPAGVLVRAMVAELRPELESYGDWETVRSLSEMALAHGSSACQQRDALHRRDRIDDVIDLVVAQTCGRARDSQIFRGIPSLLEGYAPPGFDDAILPDGRPRPSHAAALEAFAAMGPGGLQRCEEALEREKSAAGMVFRPSKLLRNRRRSRSISCRAFSPARSGVAFRAGRRSGPEPSTRSFRTSTERRPSSATASSRPGWSIDPRAIARAGPRLRRARGGRTSPDSTWYATPTDGGSCSKTTCASLRGWRTRCSTAA